MDGGQQGHGRECPTSDLSEREQRALRKLEQLDRGDLQGVPVYVASHIHAQMILLVGSSGKFAFPFMGERCDRVVHGVMARLATWMDRRQKPTTNRRFVAW